MTRPLPGSVTVRELRIQICVKCGHTVDLTGCTYGCPLDCGLYERSPEQFITAVYERTDKFLRDEKAKS